MRDAGGLAEHLGQTDDRHRPGIDQIGQELARPDRGQLIHVADEDHRAVAWHGLEQLAGQRHIDHRALVGDEQIAVQWRILLALELACCRIHLQQSVDGLGLQARRLRQPLGSASSGSAQQGVDLLGAQDRQDGIDQRRLAHSRAAGDDEQLGLQRQGNGVLLTGGQVDAQLALHPRDGLVGVSCRPGGLACGQALDLVGDRALSLVQRREEDTGLLVHRVGHQDLVSDLLVNRALDDLAGDLQELDRQRHQFGVRQPAVSLG